MFVPQKYQYALRALYELARQKEKGLVKIQDIAAHQAIPQRFLEVILNQLKGSGMVASKRGFQGGYRLVRAPEEITVGELFRYLDRITDSAHGMTCTSRSDCPLHESCAFMPMWNRVQDAIFRVYDSTTIQDLIEAKPMPFDKIER
jgi:Rrf2 family protein